MQGADRGKNPPERQPGKNTPIPDQRQKTQTQPLNKATRVATMVNDHKALMLVPRLGQEQRDGE